MELNKFCTPNGRDDLCLFFGLHTSSLRVILELSVHYNFLQRVTSVTRHSNFSFGKFSLFSLSSCKFVGCPQKKKESRTLFFPVPIRIPDWFRTFRSEYFHWMASWQSEQCLNFAGFFYFWRHHQIPACYAILVSLEAWQLQAAKIVVVNYWQYSQLYLQISRKLQGCVPRAFELLF